MKILLDMNLSPKWVGFLEQEGFHAVHWSTVGDPRATDAAIMSWARHNAFVVFSHDLDFSALLAATQATGPSVVQVRTQDVMPEAIGRDVVRVLRLRAADLEQGAVVSIDKVTSRIRVLPVGPESRERGGPGK
jgi:predicted nuclease of predicted toxin-antitoxin system